MQYNLKRKTFLLSPSKFSQKNAVLRFGYYGIKSCGFGKLTRENILYLNRFLEKLIKKNIKKKKIRIWNRMYSNLTMTKLNAESRMGKGKGSIHTMFSYVKPGQVLFEIEKIDDKSWRTVFSKMTYQFRFKIKNIQKIF